MDSQTPTWRILHIDDDEDDYFIVRSMLAEAQGRKVILEWASSLETARQQLLANDYQAVLVDYDLGTHTGIQLIQELTARGCPAPLILLTGRGSYEVDVEAMHAGATLYLTKNEINPLLLERSIRYAIERKQFEHDLLERDRKLSVALDAARLGTWSYSYTDHLLEMDERAQALYASVGRPRRSHAEVVHPDDFPIVLAALAKAANPNGDGRFQAEYRTVHPGGHIHWLDAWGLAEFEGQGAARRAVRLTGATRDITEQRQMQEENRRQKDQLERLIRSAPIAIAFVKGPQHVFDLVNAQYLAIARGKGELIGRTMADVWPEVADVIVPQLDHVYQTGERFEIDNAPFFLLRDGVWEEASFTYMFIPIYQADGRIEGIMNMAIETTHTVRARQAAEAQTKRLEAVLHALPVGVWIADVNGNILQKNQQADRIWAGDAPLSRGIEQYDAYETWDVESGKKLEPEDYPMAQTVRTGEPAAPRELRIRRFDGSEGFILVSVEPITDPDGCMTGMVAVNVDITQTMQAEQELRQKEKTLRQYTEQLERSNRELQSFAYVASHDLQEPLRKVSGFGKNLFLKLHGRMTEAEREYFERMLNSALHMQELIQDLLELSRVTTQGQAFERVDLHQVAETVVSSLDVSIAKADGQVVIGDLPVIEADALQMESLLLNLIGNGLKYCQENTPPYVELSSRTVRVEDREMTEVRVTDHGIGFDMQFAEQIFQPFRRLHGRNQYEGNGIGLALCKSIVERHGGTITAQSLPGQGSTFIVRLPLKA